MGRYGRDDDEGSQCRTLVMLAVGIGLTVGAVALITQAPDDLRGVELAEYSAYTQQWEETNQRRKQNRTTTSRETGFSVSRALSAS